MLAIHHQKPSASWVKFSLPAVVCPALGGLGAGIIALRYPGTLYWGFTNVEEILHTGKSASAPGIWLLAQLDGAKVVATALCKGSGLVGGLYTPSLMIGAVFGGLAAEIMNSAIPGNAAVAQPQAYALVGMSATLASVCSVPLTSVLLLFELTKDYRILLPLMGAVGLAIWVPSVANQPREVEVSDPRIPRRGYSSLLPTEGQGFPSHVKELCKSIANNNLEGDFENEKKKKWFELALNSYHLDAKPISLHIAASFTLPTIAPSVLHMVRSHPFSVNNCFFPLPGRVQQLKGWTSVVDDTGSEIMTIQMRFRNSGKADMKRNQIAKREVVGVIGFPHETHVLAESKQAGCYLLGSSFCLEKKPGPDGHIFELSGHQMLDYERRCCHKGKNEQDFMTAVRFSAEEPYGKAIALFNLKSNLVKVDEEWFVMPGIVLTVILSDLLRKEGYAAFVATGDVNIKEMASLEKEVDTAMFKSKTCRIWALKQKSWCWTKSVRWHQGRVASVEAVVVDVGEAVETN
ncbi:hypothetical protein ACLOJK_003044 [Asimina triloba]